MFLFVGSPPQVRGKLTAWKIKCLVNGITPAGAGKTNVKNSEFCNHWDHPRRCGENSCSALLLSLSQGSPPQVRGKRFAQYSSAKEVRITPAGAGKTPYPITDTAHCEDHPRRCGENDDIQPEFPNVAGSPPQVRGKQ